MPALRRIHADTLQQLKNLLVNNSIPVQPIQVAYKNYIIRNETDAARKPLVFSWAHSGQMEPLFFSFHTWGTVESRKFPGTFLVLGTSNEFRMVGFPLYLLPQDKDFVYLSFKLGNNEGGKNRWFGRGRTPKELRTAEQTDQLNADIRQALQRVFPAPLFKHPTLSGEWLMLARLPVTELKPQANLSSRVALKTLIFENFLQAFVIAEKLRDDSLKAAGMNSDLDNTDTEEDLSVPASMHQPLNQILYGPPGTGKTYHTALRALGLLERLTDAEVKTTYPTREEIRLRYDEYQQTGRIQFVTFHQAFSYEDFIEGIKPMLTDEALDTEETGQELGYTIADGIFKVMAQRSVYALHLQQQQRLAATAGPAQVVALDFDTVFEHFIDQLRERQAAEEQILFYTKHNSELRVASISESGTIYFRYANGNSENLPQVTRNGLRKINNDNPVDEAGQLAEADIEVRHGRDRSVYWAAFREFVKFRTQVPVDEPAPLAPQNLDDALHRVITDPKIAAEITQSFNYDKLTAADFAAAPRMVLIIDEINRGNVASIFGELITLLEDGKRAGRPERLTARLPYSKTDFTVPPNLFLLGTMNTADRSVEALDTALRRRFSFTEMQPKPAVIREQVGIDGVIGKGTAAIDVARILEVLNSRLEQLLDHDHCLGHALLLLLSPDLDSLRTAFERNIVPLLQEYFFGDWGKIGLVLGEKFVTAVPRTGAGRYPLAKFTGYDSAGLHDKPLCRLTPPATWDVVAFQSIYPATAWSADMPRIMRVLEHSILTIGDQQGTDEERAEFRPEHWDALLRYHSTGAGRRYYDIRHRAVRFKHYVGVVQAGDLTIEILPKADAVPDTPTAPTEDFDRWRRLLLRMLAEAGLLPVESFNTAMLHERPHSLLDLYLSLFLTEVEHLLRRGLVKRYRPHEGQVKALKGTLLFGLHLTRNAVHRERFYTRHQTYDHDHLPHRLLRQALVLLPALTPHPGLRGRAARALLAWPEVATVRPTAALFARLRFDRKTAAYRPALRIARLLLLRLSPDLHSGSQDLLALFFNMNRIWESYLLHTLRRLAPPSWTVSKPVKCVFWQDATQDNISRMQPDILLHHHTHGSLVLDAKWKRPDGYYAENDLRQLFAYAHQFGATRVRLLYPQAGVEPDVEGIFARPLFTEGAGSQPIHCGISYVRVGQEPATGPVNDLDPTGHFLRCSLAQELAVWLPGFPS